MEIPSSLENSPLNYVSVTTNLATADTTTDGSLFKVPGLPVNNGMVLYYPTEIDGKQIVAEQQTGFATGHVLIGGNGNVAFNAYYHDVDNDDWYEVPLTFTGREVHFYFADSLNADPNETVMFQSEILSDDTTVITVSGGAESSNDGGTTWSTTNKTYVAGSTYVRKQLTAGGAYDFEYTDTVTVNGIVETIRIVTRPAVAPLMPVDANVNVAEGNTAVGTFPVVEGEKAISYSLTGADASFFTLNATTAELAFVTPPDHEQPDDSGTDNIYDVTITANNGDSTDQMNLTVTVTDVLEVTPTQFTFPNQNNADPSTSYQPAVQLFAIDPGANVTVTGGETSNDGGVTWNAVDKPFVVGQTYVRPIATSSSDWEGVTNHEVTVNGVSDTFTITVMEEPTFPVNMGTTRNLVIDENQTVVPTPVVAVSGTAPITYSITGGDDAALLSIDSNTGAISFNEAPDFEAPGDFNSDNVYSIIVTGTNALGAVPVNVNITVQNVLADLTTLSPVVIGMESLNSGDWTTNTDFEPDASGVTADTGTHGEVSYHDIIKDIVHLRGSNLIIAGVSGVTGGIAVVSHDGKFIRVKSDATGDVDMTVNLTDDLGNNFNVSYTVSFS